MHGDEGWRMKKQDGNKIKWRTQKASKIKGKKAISHTRDCTVYTNGEESQSEKRSWGGGGGGRKWK